MNKLKRIYTNELTGTPAAVDRSQGLLYINPKLFNKLSAFEKKFVVLHEEGHYELDTADEVAADAYAFDRLAGSQWQSLKKMIETLDKLLVEGNVTRAQRLYELYKRALLWDGNNGNSEAAKEYERIKNEAPISGVSGCSGWWLFRSCKTDPMGDLQALQDAAYTAEQIDDAERLSRVTAKINLLLAQQKQEDAKRNNNLVIFAIIAVVIIVFIWE